MGFSDKTVRDCMTKSARHCCVCHRYRGVKVEVHHILPREQGGPDTEENAICLCFDCHADAGHYNPKHPRGTRFSPAELKIHKSTWYKLVEQNKIPIPPIEIRNEVAVKHLSCKSWEIVEEIVKGDLSKFPFEPPMLLNNETLTFLKKIIQDNEATRALPVENSEEFSSFEEITKKYPHGTRIDPKNPNDWALFSLHRPLKPDDLPKVPHGIIRNLAISGTPYESLGNVLYGYHECGDGAWYETFNYRTVEVVFLHLKNTSANNITISDYSSFSAKQLGYQLKNFSEAVESKPIQKFLPPVTLQPKESILICEAIVLMPFELNHSEAISRDFLQLDDPAHTQNLYRYLETNSDIKKHDLIGSFSIIENLTISFGENPLEVPIHSYDFNNYYSIDRSWNCGSCPHIFSRSEPSANWMYAGEAISSPFQNATKRVSFSEKVSEIQIAEIEPEISYLESISIFDSNGISFFSAKSIILREGDQINISIPSNVSYPIWMEVYGRYEPFGKTNFNSESRLVRNKVVSSHLHFLKERIGIPRP